MNSLTGNNDTLDRLVMRQYDASKQGAVTLFRDGGCKNDSGRFYAKADFKEVASFNKSEMESQNIRND